MQNRRVVKSFLVPCMVALAVFAMGMPDVSAKEAKTVIDLNTASPAELEGLKGIGPATAKKIIEHRPYGSVDELSKAGIPAKTIERLKPFVTAGPSAKTPQLPKTGTRPAEAPMAAEKAAAKAAKGPGGPVDLNTADQKTLESLPGVGPATAREIVKGRPFKSVEDLGRVKGMSKGKIEKLKGIATVGSQKSAGPSAPSGQAAPAPSFPAAAKPAKAGSAIPEIPPGGDKKSALKLAPGEKININTASKEMLEALPGIGPAKAKAIIEGRPYATPEDIMKVRGIKQGTFNKIRDQITVR
ncbi:MAG: helix-hairpin-helix domain-containing protein [Nitrospiraceae bacterium]|nr:helix-hairpin-helix domain-containing protein [Nitrospiraceae bacterium]